MFVRAASGRDRYHVRAAGNSVTHEVLSVRNTTDITAATVCERLQQIAARNFSGPITRVLDNARHQRCALVQHLAASLSIERLFLPSDSRNPNLIERRWKFLKNTASYGRHHDTFANFRTTIDDGWNPLATTHRSELETLRTHNSQTFDNVSVLAA